MKNKTCQKHQNTKRPKKQECKKMNKFSKNVEKSYNANDAKMERDGKYTKKGKMQKLKKCRKCNFYFNSKLHNIQEM